MTEAHPPTPDLWMIRTAQNLIAGPYTQVQVIELIREGKLGLEDEVCAASRYWFFLHERPEVIRFLGQDFQAELSRRGEEEITETDTATTDGATNPILLDPKTHQAPLPETMARPSGITPVTAPPVIPMQIQVESPSVWRGIAWALAMAALVIVYFVIRVMQRAQVP